MRGDEFRRGSSGPDDTSDQENGCPDQTPKTGRDNIPMFWESIGMKPGDDWQDEAVPDKDGRGKD